MSTICSHVRLPAVTAFRFMVHLRADIADPRPPRRGYSCAPRPGSRRRSTSTACPTCTDSEPRGNLNQSLSRQWRNTGNGLLSLPHARGSFFRHTHDTLLPGQLQGCSVPDLVLSSSYALFFHLRVLLPDIHCSNQIRPGVCVEKREGLALPFSRASHHTRTLAPGTGQR